MWPSIVQSEATRKRKSRARDLIGWALEEEGDDGLRALISDPSATSASSSFMKSFNKLSHLYDKPVAIKVIRPLVADGPLRDAVKRVSLN